MEFATRRWTRFAKSFPLKSKRWQRPIAIQRITSIADLRFAYVAYKKGWQLIPAGLSVEQFNKALVELLRNFNEAYILSALSVNNELFPVGILSILGSTHCVPYIEWFPWASVRNKTELSIYVVRELRKKTQVFLYATDEENNLMRLMRAYGLLHWGCNIKNYFANGDRANFYYTVPSK